MGTDWGTNTDGTELGLNSLSCSNNKKEPDNIILEEMLGDVVEQQLTPQLRGTGDVSMKYDDEIRTNENEDNNSDENKEDKDSAKQCSITRRMCRTQHIRAVMSKSKKKVWTKLRKGLYAYRTQTSVQWMCPLVLEPDDATFSPQKNIRWGKEKIKKIEACNYNLSAGGEDKIT